MTQATQAIIAKLNTLSDNERSEVFSELLNRYCVACGARGDWKDDPCPCEPGEPHVEEPDPQLWLVYYRSDNCDKAAE